MTRRDAVLLVRDLMSVGWLDRARPALLLLPETAEAMAQNPDDSPPEDDLSQPPEQSVQGLQQLLYNDTENLMQALTDVTGSITNLFPSGGSLPTITDWFGFLSVSLSTPTPGEALGVEAIGVAGVSDEDGPYLGGIGAAGGHVGTETTNLESYAGVERLYPSGIKTGGITLSGVNAGLEIPYLAGAGVGTGTYASGGRGGNYVSANLEVFSTLSVSLGFGFQIF